MTREQLFSLMKKHFDESQLQHNSLILNNVYTLDLFEFICDIEKLTQKVIPTEKIIPDNFRDLDSIYSLINESGGVW